MSLTEEFVPVSIITTNLTMKEMDETQKMDEARIYDRIRERCQPIVVKGESHRKENRGMMMDRFKELFRADKRGGRMNNTYNMQVWEKYTLSIEEASAYFRIGEHKLRNLINENRNADYLLWNGNRVQIKRVKFKKCVDNLESI